jgi:hypothetical protein
MSSAVRYAAATLIVCCLLGSAPTCASATKTVASEIFASANQSVGKKMWFGYGLPNGTLGCAAALCNVLKQGGVNSAHSVYVRVLRLRDRVRH